MYNDYNVWNNVFIFKGFFIKGSVEVHFRLCVQCCIFCFVFVF